MQGFLEVVGIEVGKHLGSVQNALPLRCVCKDWQNIATLGSAEATLDLEPDGPPTSSSSASQGPCHRRLVFFRRCPQLRKFTYHVAPRVPLKQFEAAMHELASSLPHLEELTILFSNAGQQLETRHLAALSCLHGLRALTLQANLHPDVQHCDLGAALQGCSHLHSFTLLASEASHGLTDAHLATLAALPSLESLAFPGHARGFSGAAFAGLAAALPRLGLLAVAGSKPGAVDYSLSLPALAGLRALTRRPSSASPPLQLEVGVPDAAFAAALLRAVAGPGLASVSITVREAADSGSLAALASAPGAAQQLVGLDLEFRAAPTAADIAALAGCSRLRRLHLSCKCPRAPPAAMDWAPWLQLRELEHLHLHINPAWRAPLQPGALATMAAAWPRLQHLHLRLSPSDNATHALTQLSAFKELRTLSLTWLGQASPAAGLAGTRGRRSSLDVAAFNLAFLPRGLQELSLTSISTVRLGLPPSTAPGPGCQEAAAAAPVLPKLRSLTLDGNFGVSDELLGVLLAHAPALSSLTLVLAGRQSLSSEGLQAALAAAAAMAAAACCGSNGLSSLAISDYREAPLCLSQASLAGLASAGLAKLRHLKLSTPDVVHADLLPAVFAGFTKLRRLELLGCQDQAAAALGTVLPLCCIKPGPEWAGDVAAAAAAVAAAAAAAQAAAAAAPAAAVAVEVVA